MLDCWNSGWGLRVLVDRIDDVLDVCIEVLISGLIGFVFKVVCCSFDSWCNSIVVNCILFGYVLNDVFVVLGGLFYFLIIYVVIEVVYCCVGLIFGGGMGCKVL